MANITENNVHIDETYGVQILGYKTRINIFFKPNVRFKMTAAE